MSKPLSQNQKTFNKVAKHLLTQKKKSLLPINHPNYKDVKCAYRGENGLKCGIGALIPNKDYIARMEGQGTEGFDVKSVLKKYNHDRSLCYDLQQVHDKNKPSRWKQKLRAFAKQNQLDASALDKF